MAINFPDTPNDGDSYTAGGRTWVYDSAVPAWQAQSVANHATTHAAGGTDEVTPASLNLEIGVDVQAYDAQLASLAGLSYTGNTLKVVRVNAGETAFELATPSGGGDALVANPLSQFAATTSVQLAGVISDETGSGALVFATSPTLVTPALGVPASGTLTNCTGLPTAGLVDDAVTLAKMASGTAGNLITYDASGNPAAVATGTSGHVLTSNGAGAAPTFQAAAGGGDSFIGDLQSQVAELAFDLAILRNEGVYAMSNGVAITYDDSTGIDAGASSNYYLGTSFGNSLIEIVRNQNSSTDTFTQTPVAWGISDYCVVDIIPQSLLNNTGSLIRVQFDAPASASVKLDDVFVSQVAASGDAYDSHTDITRITFNGANGTTIPANGTTWSDWVSYSLDSTKNLIVAMDVGSSTSGHYAGTISGWNSWYKAATNEAGTQNRSAGYTSNGEYRHHVKAIDVMGPTLNMTLISTAYTAASAPTTVAFTMRFNEPDSDVTLNTDLTVEISRDDGTTWSTMTLTELRTSGTTVVVSGTVDVSGQPSGSSLKSRIKTPGGSPKEVEIIAHTLQVS